MALPFLGTQVLTSRPQLVHTQALDQAPIFVDDSPLAITCFTYGILFMGIGQGHVRHVYAFEVERVRVMGGCENSSAQAPLRLGTGPGLFLS